MDNTYDPELILKEADTFILCYEALIRAQSKYVVTEPNKAISITRAANVNHAFAFELYLKCLLCIEGKEIPEHHELTKLFALLNAVTKNTIVSEFDKGPGYYNTVLLEMHLLGFASKKIEFIGLLRQTPKAFSSLRYKYEKGRKVQNYELDKSIKYVRATILKLKPELIGYL